MAVLAIVYGLFLGFVVFWPSPIDAPVASILERAIAELHERGVPTFVDYDFIEFTANIALFIPVGFLFGLMVPLRLFILALLSGPLLSAGIEVVQHVMLDGRYSTIADVIANSIGATVGVFMAATIRAVVAIRDDKVIARFQAQQRALTS